MSDAQLLHRRLRLLLALPLLGAACDRGSEPATGAATTKAAEPDATSVEVATTEPAQTTGEVSTTATGSESGDIGGETGGGETGGGETGDTGTEVSALPGGLSGRPEMPRMPSCPTTTWCGDQRLAARYRVGPEDGKRCAAQARFPGGFTWTTPGGRERKLSSKRVGAFDEGATELAKADEPRTCCYTWTDPCPGGRPYAEDERMVVAAHTTRNDWCVGSSEHRGLEPDPELAQAWAEDAALEHASVASFARVVHELLALGAPPQLILECSAAIQDELRHARACYAIASRYAGVELGPGPLPLLPTRSPSVARFIRDTFREGCVGETVAALAAERAAGACDDPEIRAVLDTIASDEARHAALAWRSIAWLIGEQPELGRRALRACLAELEAELADVPEPSSEASTGLGPGRLSHAALTDARRDALVEIVAPLARTLLTDERAGAMAQARPRGRHPLRGRGCAGS